MKLYDKISSAGKKLALLIDPDKQTVTSLISTIYAANEANVKMIFIGGSLLSTEIDNTIEIIKKHTDIPVILFPGSIMQISSKADAILFLSMVSGRNPEYLIGNHVLAAPYIRKTKLEVIPTGYILVDGGSYTSVEYISNTRPIPASKTDIITSTAMASEMLGHNLIYLECGSGASNHVPEEAIREVKRNISIPLIVGGGIDSPEKIQAVAKAGADIVVLGSAVEKSISNLRILSGALGLL